MPWEKSEPMDQRREFAMKALGTLNFRALCQEYGISAKTGYKWRERFLRQGLEGMEEDSRRPRSSPKQLSESQVCEMVKLEITSLPPRFALSLNAEFERRTANGERRTVRPRTNSKIYQLYGS